MKRLVAHLALAVSALMVFAGCSWPQSGGSSAAQPTITLRVFAAASLTQVYPEIATKVFAPSHPNVKVQFTYDGSAALVDQLKNGAPADVFASADEPNMDKAVKASVALNPVTFAGNVLVLITAPGNPAKITGLDSSLDGKKLVVCAPQVPCGNASRTLARQKGYELAPVSEEQKVTDVVAKVTSGEADAGLVYTTDAKTAGSKVGVVEIPGSEKVINNYRIALVAKAPQAGAGDEFIKAVLSAEGQKILAQYGFRTVTGS